MSVFEQTAVELRRAAGEARQRWGTPAWLAFAALLVAAAIPFLSLPGVRTDALADTAYLALAATALGLTVGPAGLPSLGTGAFMAIGAFTSALLVARSGWALEPAVLAGTAAALVAGLLCGAVVRLRREFVAVSTWLLAWLVWLFLLAFPSVSGGSQGLILPQKTLLGLDDQIVPYSTYPLTTQLLISVFVASQAPALVSRDLRFRTITLYLARPMRRTTYVLVRLASLTAATFVLVAAPLLLMYVGGLLAGLPLGRETGRILGALVGAALLAACLSGLAALVSALTIRRGLAVAAVIVVLLVSYTVVATIQGISFDSGHETVGQVAGLFSPYTLVNGVQVILFNAPEATPTPPSGAGQGALYLATTALVVLGSVGAMLARYRKVAA